MHARLALTVLATCLAGCAAHAPPPAASSDPDALAVPAGSVLVFKARGAGVQIYDCRAAADDASRFAWALRGPEAQLLDERGAAIGRHYAGPTWDLADGSRVAGEVKARSDSPTAGNIPWLLLEAKGNAGSGLLSTVSAIQRLHTEGGVAPAEGCDATHAGAMARVPYKADYSFYAAP
jgi:hypothetical protein